MNTDRLSKIAFDVVMMMFASGASYGEGQAILTCALALIKQVDRTPDMDEDAIATLAMSIIANELNSCKKTSQA